MYVFLNRTNLTVCQNLVSWNLENIPYIVYFLVVIYRLKLLYKDFYWLWIQG